MNLQNKEQLSNLKITQKINGRAKSGLEDSLNLALGLINILHPSEQQLGWQEAQGAGSPRRLFLALKSLWVVRISPSNPNPVANADSCPSLTSNRTRQKPEGRACLFRAALPFPNSLMFRYLVFPHFNLFLKITISGYLVPYFNFVLTLKTNI